MPNLRNKGRHKLEGLQQVTAPGPARIHGESTEPLQSERAHPPRWGFLFASQQREEASGVQDDRVWKQVPVVLDPLFLARHTHPDKQKHRREVVQPSGNFPIDVRRIGIKESGSVSDIDSRIVLLDVRRRPEIRCIIAPEMCNPPAVLIRKAKQMWHPIEIRCPVNPRRRESCQTADCDE
jgi:hypothetical protein